MWLLPRIWIFLASLVGLVKSSDYFTEYSEKLGLMFGLSSFIIWATIVALGTSLPELISGIYAVIGWWLPEYVVDGAIGSNIANVLLVFGIWSIVAKKLVVNTKLIDVDLPFFFISMSMFLFLAWDRIITWQESIFLLAFIVIFILYSISQGEETETVDDKVKEVEHSLEKNPKNLFTYISIIIVSMAALAFSAKYLIDSVLEISTLLWISSSVLTLSVVALGTSLPEVLTSVMAIKRGNPWIAFGNVFGSNTFNLTLITGIPAFFWDLVVSDFTYTTWFGFLILVSILTIIMTLDNKIVLREGVALLLLYVLFIAKLTAFI